MDPNGDLYVTDILDHHVQKFDSSGNFICKWGIEGTGDGEFDEPAGIGISSSGEIYIVDSMNQRIQKYTTTTPVIPVTWGRIKALYSVGQ